MYISVDTIRQDKRKKVNPKHRVKLEDRRRLRPNPQNSFSHYFRISPVRCIENKNVPFPKQLKIPYHSEVVGGSWAKPPEQLEAVGTGQ